MQLGVVPSVKQLLQQRIALAQHPAKPACERSESVFHVEHSPIQQLAARLGCPDDDLNRVRIEQMTWQLLRQARRAVQIKAVEPGVRTTVPSALDAEPVFHAVVRHDCRDHRPRLVVGDRNIKAGGAEGAPRAEQVNRLENGGLASAICAKQAVALRPRGDLLRLEVAQPGNIQPHDAHCSVRGASA